MSATRDKSQKITFVYSNLYSIYRKGIERAREGAIQESGRNSPSLGAEALTELAIGRPGSTSAVLKAADLRTQAGAVAFGAPAARRPATPPPAPTSLPRVSPYTPAELIGRRVARPASIAGEVPDAVQSLKKNLESLNDLQSRLRFMLKELEDLIKD